MGRARSSDRTLLSFLGYKKINDNRRTGFSDLLVSSQQSKISLPDHVSCLVYQVRLTDAFSQFSILSFSGEWNIELYPSSLSGKCTGVIQI